MYYNLRLSLSGVIGGDVNMTALKSFSRHSLGQSRAWFCTSLFGGQRIQPHGVV